MLKEKSAPFRLITVLTLSLAVVAGLCFRHTPPAAAHTQVLPSAPVQPAGSFKINFDYSKVDSALFNDRVKEQIESGARIIEHFIDNGEITITVVNGETGSAYATGAPSAWVDDQNTEERSTARTGGIRFSTNSIREAAKGGQGTGIAALTMHEILHCLGFTNSAKALAKHLKNGTYSSPNVLKVNNGKPVKFHSDNAHFTTDTKDALGISPRMNSGGGGTLSVLDLAVLADLGYDVPLINHAEGVPSVAFNFPAGYYDEEEKEDKPVYGVSGLAGNDVLQAFKDHAYSLVGGGGDDILVGGTGDDFLDGDNARTLTNDPRLGIPEPGKPGADKFIIRKNGGKDTIYGFESGKDEIWLSPALGITEEQIEEALKTFPIKKQTPIPGSNMVRVETINLIKIGAFELIVDPAGKVNPKASDFKIEDWNP